ncbi:MAG TPA: hypothetical protein VLM78_05585, partial [Anaerolineales bacterium]|nr:hypothetical protein [Anaerolineales bacterium]
KSYQLSRLWKRQASAMRHMRGDTNFLDMKRLKVVLTRGRLAGFRQEKRKRLVWCPISGEPHV